MPGKRRKVPIILGNCGRLVLAVNVDGNYIATAVFQVVVFARVQQSAAKIHRIGFKILNPRVVFTSFS